jgi:hypothetical protein
MKRDVKIGYADKWIVVTIVVTELIIVALVTYHHQQNHPQIAWDALFWITSVGYPAIMVILEIILNITKRPRPFLWGSIAASVVLLALCGLFNSYLPI